MKQFKLLKSAVLVAALLSPLATLAADISLLNVSYDPTRELYVDYNAAFAKHWKEKPGITSLWSSRMEGLVASACCDWWVVCWCSDACTFLWYWRNWCQSQADSKRLAKRLPHNSSPYTSTIVLLVRKGNPKGIKDWNDLTKPGISVITPNPKTSGGARWNYLAAYAYALKHNNNDDAKARDFVKKIFKNVPVLDSGARGSTTTFVERGIGDVLISWENEAFLAQKELGPDKFEIVVPTLSILAEPPVTVIDKVVDKRKTRAVAQAYLEYLYSEEGQEIAAKNYYRPTLESVAKKYEKQFPSIQLIKIDDVFGGWQKAQKTHFADGGVFDEIYQK